MRSFAQMDAEEERNEGIERKLKVRNKGEVVQNKAPGS